MRTHLSTIVFTFIALFVCRNVQAQVDSALVIPDSAMVIADSSRIGEDSFSLSIKPAKGGLETVVDYKSRDSVRLNVPGKKVYLYGKAVVVYGDMKLEADFIEVDFATNDLHAVGVKDSAGIVQGEPIFTSEGKVYHAEEMWYNFKTKKGISSGVLTTESDGVLRGKKILRDSTGNTYLKGATFTTCKAPEPHFWIEADKFKVVDRSQVVSGPANLVIEGVNTPLFVPFAFFPINKARSKGVVIGSYGETVDRGFYLNNWGYYFPVNDYFDLKLTGDIYFRGSYGFHLVSRYRRRYKYSGQVAFDFNKNFFGEKEAPDYTVSNDYAVRWNYTKDGKSKPGTNFSANVNFVSRNQLRNNSQEVNDILATNANSSVNYSRSFLNRKLNFSTSGRIDQNLGTGELNMRLPDMNVNLVRIQPFANLSGPRSKKKALRNFGISYQSQLQNSLQINQDSIIERNNGVMRFHPDVQENIRFGVKHSMPFSTSFKAFKYFNISPSVNFADHWYFKTIEKSWENDTLITRDVRGFQRASTYSASISMNTTIYGFKQFRKGKLYAIRHVMRPTLSGSWAPQYNEQERFGYREVQSDTAGNTQWYSIFEGGILGAPSGGANGALNMSIGNNLEIKVRSEKDTSNGGLKKVKIIESLNVSSGYNFLADSLNLRNISMSGNTTLFKMLRFTFSAGFDPYDFTYDSTRSRNVRINDFSINNGKLVRMTSSRLSLSTNLNPQALKPKTSPNASEEELEVINAYSQYFVDFNIPWSLNLSYSFNFSRSFDEEARKEQTVTFNGDVKLTENWKIGFSSGYNFQRKESTLTKIDFFRDLHCWEFSFGWIPTGTYRRFDFVIRVKSATLQDLKLTRRGFWYDN